ncbi:MAG: zincin-like metallopeptidase domain-containing protein, partial [Hyphomonadaceae bacterium]
MRKGEKACPVIYYGSAPVRDGTSANDPDADCKTYRFLKLFHVFNVEQIDDLPPDFSAGVAPVPRALPAISEWVRSAGARACYSPITDAIHMPPVEAFNDEEAWSPTLAHEAIHFTGHSSRLDRLADYARDRKARAREELIA